MITLDGAQAGRALGSQALAEPVTGVSIDSRSLQKGDLFVAIRGEKFDGHDFVQAAFDAGACGAVVQKADWRGRAGVDIGRVYPVKDTVKALGSLAREVRRASSATVYGITGSVGKTSTKDLLKAALGRVSQVVATKANQNNEVGLPLTLLSIESDTEAVVAEMGMRGLGQIAELATIAEPDVGVITNIHPVHLELLGTLENVAQAKAELVGGVRKGGVAVVPAACEVLEPLLHGCDCRLVRYAATETESGAGITGAEVTGWLESDSHRGGQILRLRWPDEEIRVAVSHLPKHTLENAVAALAACYASGLPIDECARGVAEAEASEGRGRIIELGPLCVIDDTYNANPAAVRAAVDDLVQRAKRRGGRAVAVIGDMLELGPESSRFHEEVGVYAAEAGVSLLWGVGPRTEATVGGFTHWCEVHQAVGEEWGAGHAESSADAEGLLPLLEAGDVVLFKASRGVRLENMIRKVVDEASAGRWGERRTSAGTGATEHKEKRRC